MKVYLSGPMTGLPKHNYPAFLQKAAVLRGLGITVLNPAEHFGGDRSLDRTEYLEADARDILAADAIVVMEGWERSKGAQWEIDFARGVGRPVACEKCFAVNLRANWTAQRSLDDAVVCFNRQWSEEQAHVAEFGPREPNAGPEDEPEDLDRAMAEAPMFAAQTALPDTPTPAPISLVEAIRAYPGSVTIGGVTTKAAPTRESFETGSQRGSRAGKGRFDLLPERGVRAVAGVCERGALIYGARNIEQGQPVGRLLDSGLRHIFDYLAGKTDEDHLAQAAWNLLWARQFDETRHDLVDIPAQREARFRDDEERPA